jgi:hypothetical protein
VNVKTRKRNIVVPEDPKTFANAVIQIIKDASEGVSIERDLEAATKVLESSDAFDFKRYGETLFEIFYAGGRLAGGGTYADEGEASRLDNSVGFALRQGLLAWSSVHPVLVDADVLLHPDSRGHPAVPEDHPEPDQVQQLEPAPLGGVLEFNSVHIGGNPS